MQLAPRTLTCRGNVTVSEKSISVMHRVQGLFFFLLAAVLPAASLARPPEFDSEFYDDIPSGFREKVGVVVRVPTISKRVQVDPFKSSLPTYEFLLEELPLASKISRAADIATYVVEPRDNGFHVDDQVGLCGMLYPLHQEPGLRIFYAEGTADASFLPTLSGRGVMEIRFCQSDAGFVENSVTIWLQLDNRVLRLVTKVVWPLVGRLVRRKTSTLERAARELSERLHSEPEKLCRYLEKSGLASAEELAKLRRLLSTPNASHPSPAPPPSGD